MRWLALHIEMRFIPLARGTHFLDPFTTLFIRFIPAGAGTLRVILMSPLLTRFIPAGAGTLIQKKNQKQTRRFIPLARGTHRLFRVFPVMRGLSRWRGNTVRAAKLFDHVRFIPAGAGNT
ncbi:hypothetical protein JS565_12755 [Salmonella enterica subsp. enterica serovar Senftenberg]|nr:hypothetical protein [Salmonella enterica subsp. enterica serovar Senftenberg]